MFQVDVLVMSPKFYVDLFMTLISEPLGVSTELKDLLSNERLAYQFMCIVEDRFDRSSRGLVSLWFAAK